ncbi:MAG: Holliday junction branch migration DNA helicase RuvB [Endomicrobium sp.]|jgi:Holliday junction DNA helicase RuvB|nr:Holliday junction branch migration DNA helicase RuvB [Endomicrobium sp.]
MKNCNKNKHDKLDFSLRPKKLEDFVGQENVKNNLKVFIAASKKRNEPLDHCLFFAPSGLGKTTLSYIIAKEMGGNLKITSGPTIEKIGDLAAILSNLKVGDVFFIDEIHRMVPTVEESLYSVMEDFQLDIMIGKGPSAKTIKLPIPQFTLIGATTRAGLISNPLRNRFGIIEHLDFYSIKELQYIVKRSATLINIDIDEEASKEIAKRARGTPRIVNRLLKRVRDFADIKDCKISKNIAVEALNSLDIDTAGLNRIDRLILKILLEKFDGGPVGIKTIATILSEDLETVTDIYEPYLIKLGFISRTSRGRIITNEGKQHIKNNNN